MKTNKRINTEVDRTLDSLNDFPKQSPDAFFNTRLNARIEKTLEQESYLFGWLNVKPALQLAFVLAFVVLNVVSLSIFTLNSGYQINDETVESFATDYEMDQSTELLVDLNE